MTLKKISILLLLICSVHFVPITCQVVTPEFNENVDGSGEKSDSDDDTTSQNVSESPPINVPIGTQLRFTMNSKPSGQGMSTTIYFTVKSNNELEMYCNVVAQPGTPAARIWLSEFASTSSNVTNSEEADASVISAGRQTGKNGAFLDNDDTRPVQLLDLYAASSRQQKSCDRTMPHLYVLKDTNCCNDPSLPQCACSDGKKLGCIEATGEVRHTFSDLSYADLESSCLAITNEQVSRSSCGSRGSKFISAGPAFFRTFASFNLNGVSYLSSGTKTIAAPSSGGIAISVPSSVSGTAIFTGSTYKPGLLDTLPYIRLEGVSVDIMYTVVLALMLVYSAMLLYPLFTQGPLFRRISDPLMRAGDFISERMDVLEKVVKKSISNIRSKKQSFLGAEDDYLDYYEEYADYNRRNGVDYNDVAYPDDYTDSYQYYYK